MARIDRCIRPKSLGEALAAKSEYPDSAWLAGGTALLARGAGSPPPTLIDIRKIVDRGIRPEGAYSILGAGLSFQDILESQAAPSLLKEAARSMVNRNVRNMATLGGNLGADKSSSSLIPALLVVGCSLRCSDGGGDFELPLEAWLASRRGLVRSAAIGPLPGRRSAYRRWSRTAADLAVLGAAVSFEAAPARLGAGDGPALRDLKIAVGGVGPHVRRCPAVEALFEGRRLPGRDEMVRAIRPLLAPESDLRGSAEFKALRAAELIAEALVAAEAGS